METLRIHYLAALIVPIAYAIACGGSDNPSESGAAAGAGGAGNAGAGATCGPLTATGGAAGAAGAAGAPTSLTLKGCCDQTGVCGVAFQFMTFSQCITAADAQMFGMGRGGGGAPGAGGSGAGGFMAPPNETVVLDSSCPDQMLTLMMGAQPEAGAPKPCSCH